MKVLLSISYYAPHISGLTRYAENLAEALAQNDVTVTVLTSQHTKALPLKETINGVHIIRVPVTFMVSKGPIMFGLLAKSIQLIPDVDVVNCHLPQFESFIIALLAKSFGKKLIVTYHTDLDNGKSFIQKLVKQVLLFSHTVTCWLADTIVIQTEDNAQYSSFLKRFRNKLVSIYPPIIPPILASQEAKTALHEHIGKKDAYYIGFLGRMAKEKGIEYLLEALTIIKENMGKDCLLLLAGPQQAIGEHSYQQKIMKLIAKEKNSILSLGILSEDEKNAFYKALDVFVLPSVNTTEAFGMVQVEAMYCGIPVVATNLPGVRVPIMQTGMGEIVKPQNSSALAGAVVKILQNKKKYIKPVEVIQKKFSIDKILNEYQKLFGD